jgi:NAD(P)-dependent dehydrogenase (short-subunit alcohol dehydrogenase family)
MSKVILVAGFGTGISDSVARRFGKEGYSVAIVARTPAHLAKAEHTLKEAGIETKGFPCDLSDVEAVRRLVPQVQSALGPIAVLHWNAYLTQAGDLTTASTEELRRVLDVGVHGFLAAVQEALPDLKAQKGAILVTGGGLCFYDANVDAAAGSWGAMGLAVAKAAQHKLTGLLHQKLKSDGVYVGEVTVTGTVKNTDFDRKHGGGTLDPDKIAERFWDLAQRRTDVWVTT